MPQGTIRISDVFLKEALMIPEDFGIAGVQWDPQRQIVTLILDGERVPAGEIDARFTRHDDGLYVKWVPMRETAKQCDFLRSSLTGRCFWCDKPREDHQCAAAD